MNAKQLSQELREGKKLASRRRAIINVMSAVQWDNSSHSTRPGLSPLPIRRDSGFSMERVGKSGALTADSKSSPVDGPIMVS